MGHPEGRVQFLIRIRYGRLRFRIIAQHARHALTRAAPEAPAIPPAPEPEPVPKPVPASTDRAAITLLNGRRRSIAASLAPVMLTRLVQASDPS